ncbi:hypothetical protein F7725_006795 [Dissostichus mawsoni]|uniref:Uncharacterized protein n=1 Tax=Dissostichus mawsoni TaxID=36200 RepID=A0A7J5XVV8_DISMA|nr:hypothetical protein F7725_006795 [Dissostichus mawsoni]
MEAVDSSMEELAVNSVVDATGNEETANDTLDCADNENGIKTAKDEDVRRNAESADSAEDSADATDGRTIEINDIIDSMDQSVKGESTDCESDADSSNEDTYLEAMTPDGHDYYLRLGKTPRRRSALRLSRILARQQLLRRLAQGRSRESSREVIMRWLGIL